MSHYAVAVFSDDCRFDDLLAPYGENNKNEFEFKSVEYAKILEDFKEFQKHNSVWTLEMYLDEFGYHQKDGQWGYECNPHGYWDWYSLDGKDYLFDLKEWKELDSSSDDWEGYYRKNDYDWYPDDSEAEADAIDFWDSFVGDGAFAEPPGLWSRQYYLERYKTKEQYVKECKRVVPYAFITPDGVWHAPGRVGWFASSDETAEGHNKYIEEWDAWINSDANPYVSLVDCHI